MFFQVLPNDRQLPSKTAEEKNAALAHAHSPRSTREQAQSTDFVALNSRTESLRLPNFCPAPSYRRRGCPSYGDIVMPDRPSSSSHDVSMHDYWRTWSPTDDLVDGKLFLSRSSSPLARRSPPESIALSALALSNAASAVQSRQVSKESLRGPDMQRFLDEVDGQVSKSSTDFLSENFGHMFDSGNLLQTTLNRQMLDARASSHVEKPRSVSGPAFVSSPLNEAVIGGTSRGTVRKAPSGMIRGRKEARQTKASVRAELDAVPEKSESSPGSPASQKRRKISVIVQPKLENISTTSSRAVTPSRSMSQIPESTQSTEPSPDQKSVRKESATTAPLAPRTNGR